MKKNINNKNLERNNYLDINLIEKTQSRLIIKIFSSSRNKN